PTILSSLLHSPALPTPPVPPLSLHDALPIFCPPPPRSRLTSSRFHLARMLSGCSSNASRYARSASARCASRLALSDFASRDAHLDRKSTRLNSSHVSISYAVFCLKKKNKK